eukprot:3265103-Prymnesium_polylepis.1
MRSTKRRSCDLAVEGSPSSRTLMSPRRWVPFLRFFSWPPSSMSSSACQRAGARGGAAWPPPRCGCGNGQEGGSGGGFGPSSR